MQRQALLEPLPLRVRRQLMPGVLQALVGARVTLCMVKVRLLASACFHRAYIRALALGCMSMLELRGLVHRGLWFGARGLWFGASSSAPRLLPY